MALGKLPVPGRPAIWMIVGQGPPALAIGAGGVCLDIFTLISPLSPSLWWTARYRLKYCLKGLLNPKQPTKLFGETARYRQKYYFKGPLSPKRPTNGWHCLDIFPLLYPFSPRSRGAGGGAEAGGMVGWCDGAG